MFYKSSTPNETERPNEHGSALVMAIFVLLLLTSMGISLVFVSQIETRMANTGVNTKKAFYLAEAAEEDARTSLFAVNGDGPFSDYLADGLGGGAAGANGVIDFDPDLVRAVYSTNGNVTGFTGFGDDVPLRSLTAFADGYYIAFLTNDAIDGVTATVDTNDTVMITGVGVGPGNSFEIVHAIIDRDNLIPMLPPAAITMLGPTPNFYGGNSNKSEFNGEDCDGSGIDDLYVSTVGTIDAAAKATAETGITYPNGPDFVSDPAITTNEETISNLNDTSDPLVVWPMDPEWTDCLTLRDMIENIRSQATHLCSGAVCPMPPGTTSSSITFIDNGDSPANEFAIGPTDPDGLGMLVVTGTIKLHGKRKWHGIIMAVGRGSLERYGSGNGEISGAVMVADIAGPDDMYGTSDDCTGGPNNDGFGIAIYDQAGGGNGDATFCSTDITASIPPQPYTIISFRQR